MKAFEESSVRPREPRHTSPAAELAVHAIGRESTGRYREAAQPNLRYLAACVA